VRAGSPAPAFHRGHDVNDYDGPPCRDGADALELAREHHDVLIALVGLPPNRANGAIGTMRKDIATLQEWQAKVNGAVVKMSLAVIGAALAGGGIVAALLRAL
jgi:hypothetical protein